MDTSEVYIKMCEKAEGIQKKWNPLPGDFIHHKFTLFGEEINHKIWPQIPMWEINIVWFRSEIDSYFACTDEKGNNRIYKHPTDMKRETCIWLPRQDQMQEMINSTDISNLFDKFFSYYTLNWSVRSTPWWNNISFEQLWLAFVIKEKFNKIWNGEKWIEQDSIGY